METLVASLRRVLQQDRDHHVRYVTPILRARDEGRRLTLPPYLGHGCYLRQRHAPDCISVDVHVLLWSGDSYRREAWHDYLVPASPDYAGWMVPYQGRAWRLCPNDDPRYRRYACEACRDPRIVMETADVEALNAGKARKGRRPQFV